MKLKGYIRRTAALILAGAMLLSFTAYADNVEVAESPSGSESSSNIIYSSGTSQNIISSSGPTATKKLNENGVLVYSAGGTEETSGGTAGPGSGASSASDASSASASADASASSGTSLISIDESIAKPEISSEAAILYDITTGQTLYEKNADEKLYPASTTKLMTALLAVEKLDLNGSITVNASAVNNLESGATTAGMKAGDTITVTDALHAVLMKSACEVANALAEAVSGSQSDFAALMNEKAAALGCTNTHFANASGLNDTNHYTTVRDMALIAKEALNNSTISSILLKKTYELPATSGRGKLSIINTNKVITGSESIEGYLGGKTGYTSKAGSCLASLAERNGHRLIAVTFKAKSPAQYSDARNLYDYAEKLIGGSSSSVTASGTDTAVSNTSSSAASGSWEKLSTGEYKYKKADGSYYANEWLDLDGNSYFFDSNGIMCTGWKQFTNGSWYYFNPENGAMVKSKWVALNNKSYYLQADGTMATNTVIDGKYQVDENGVYVKKVG